MSAEMFSEEQIMHLAWNQAKQQQRIQLVVGDTKCSEPKRGSIKAFPEWRYTFFILFHLYSFAPTLGLKSGIGTGFPISAFAGLTVGCQRVIEPVSYLFFINQELPS